MPNEKQCAADALSGAHIGALGWDGMVHPPAAVATGGLIESNDGVGDLEAAQAKRAPTRDPSRMQSVGAAYPGAAAKISDGISATDCSTREESLLHAAAMARLAARIDCSMSNSTAGREEDRFAHGSGDYKYESAFEGSCGAPGSCAMDADFAAVERTAGRDPRAPSMRWGGLWGLAEDCGCFFKAMSPSDSRGASTLLAE